MCINVCMLFPHYCPLVWSVSMSSVKNAFQHGRHLLLQGVPKLAIDYAFILPHPVDHHALRLLQQNARVPTEVTQWKTINLKRDIINMQ